MIRTGGTKRLISGGWIIAALIVVAYNGLLLSSVFSPPIVGQSKDARLASQKWLRLENKMKARAKQSVDHGDAAPVVARFTPKWPAAEKKTETASSTQIPATGERVATVALVPPVLTGIMEVTDDQGFRRLSAVMEGRRWVEKERIRGFTVERITLKGVQLTHSGKEWFIPAPMVYFMKDQGG